MRIWGQKQWYRADHIPVSPSSSSHRPLRLSSLFFFSASYQSLYRRKERVFTLENRKTLKIVKMLILGPICSTRAGCISDQQSQSPQTVIIEFFSLKLVGLHEENDRISLQRAVKAKKQQKCLLWGPYARSGQLAAHDLLRNRYF